MLIKYRLHFDFLVLFTPPLRPGQLLYHGSWLLYYWSLHFFFVLTSGKPLPVTTFSVFLKPLCSADRDLGIFCTAATGLFIAVKGLSTAARNSHEVPCSSYQSPTFGDFIHSWTVNAFCIFLPWSSFLHWKFLLEIKWAIFLFKPKLIPWAPVQNIDQVYKALKVRCRWQLALKFWSPALIFLSHWRPAGRNFGPCIFGYQSSW